MLGWCSRPENMCCIGNVRFASFAHSGVKPGVEISTSDSSLLVPPTLLTTYKQGGEGEGVGGWLDVIIIVYNTWSEVEGVR